VAPAMPGLGLSQPVKKQSWPPGAQLTVSTLQFLLPLPPNFPGRTLELKIGLTLPLQTCRAHGQPGPLRQPAVAPPAFFAAPWGLRAVTDLAQRRPRSRRGWGVLPWLQRCSHGYRTIALNRRRQGLRAGCGKSRRSRAYPQQIVTTRLLYCLQDPFAQLSRLQRI
jgi:hypothetical protein